MKPSPYPLVTSPKPKIEEIYPHQNKECSLCGSYQSIKEFRIIRRHGKWAPASWCNPCCHKRKHDFYYKNQDKCIAYSGDYYFANKEECVEKGKVFRKKNKDKIRKNKKIYYEKAKHAPEFKEKCREHQRRRRKQPKYILLDRLRQRVRWALLKQKADKSGRTEKLLGCSIEYFRDYFEKLFKLGMTWENKHLWHVDHIRPCASFDLTDPEQQKKCFHYTNLQPLWALENLLKSDKYEKNS